jgi:hypothetical protein
VLRATSHKRRRHVERKIEGDSTRDTGAVNFVGATPSASDVVVSSEVPLTAGAPGGALYEWLADQPAAHRLALVSLLPEDEDEGKASGASFGDPGEAFVNVARRMISATGSRVLFSAKAPEQEHQHLYMRDMIKGETVRLDVAEHGSTSQALAVFQTASVDGSKAFFTDSAQLMKGAGGTAPDLYECEMVEVEESGQLRLKCDLSDLTPVPAMGQPGAGESADVLGVLGASEDGSYVYFVAGGVLAAGAAGSAPLR